MENPRRPGLFFFFFCSLISAVAVVGAVESVGKAGKPACRLFFPRVEKGAGTPRRRWRDGGKPPGFPRGKSGGSFPQRIHRGCWGKPASHRPAGFCPSPPASGSEHKAVRAAASAPPGALYSFTAASISLISLSVPGTAAICPSMYLMEEITVEWSRENSLPMSESESSVMLRIM